jgi:magnesium-protoporphyrin O-methyltransferase
MADSSTYTVRRGEIETYFDRTAVEAWKRLTSDAPVNGVRATVRAGRDRMRATLLSWLPMDLSGIRLLDAGCGTGALAVEAARRGATVVAVDLSPQLVRIAAERAPADLGGTIDFRSGDMLSEDLGRFDYVVGMDSLIHYRAMDAVRVLEGLAARTSRAVLFTFAPRTPLLAVMHAVGRLIPQQSTRAPAIEPVAPARLRRLLEHSPALGGWQPARTLRVSSGFYTSQAMELRAR